MFLIGHVILFSFNWSGKQSFWKVEAAERD